MFAEEYRIRPAAVADAPLLVQSRRHMFEDMGEGDTPGLDSVDAALGRWLPPRLADGRASGWIAESADGTWIGALSVSHHEVPPARTNLAGLQSYLFGLWVRAEWRRRGVARALLNAALEASRARGEGAAALYASDAGRPLYESLGFVDAPWLRLVFAQADGIAGENDGVWRGA